MADQKFTRCPGCATVFRVTPEQLALREGQVRCGHCRAVFDANSHLVSVEVRALEDEAPDELLGGRPTVTLRDSRALQSVVEPGSPAVASDVALPEVAAGESGEAEATPDATDAPPEDAVAQPEVAVAQPEVAAGAAAAAGRGSASPQDMAELEAARAALRRRAPRPRSGNAFYVFAILMLVAGLGAQALLEFHDSLAARLPRLTPVLASACRWLSCTIRPMRNTSALSIEGSDLQADPAHQGLLILTATVRNRSAYALAYPYLELTLTDASDQVVVRRAFAPSEYLGAKVMDRDAGIAGNHEQLVRLFIDASTSNQAGYRLYLFYP